MRELRNTFTRIGAFARKEIFDVLRQPRLLLTLILGPFLILALFGLGYRQQSEPLRTVFVTSGDGDFTQQLQDRANELEHRIDILGTVGTRAEAVGWLRRGAADVAVIVPVEPIETVRRGERAVFTVLHDKLDPFEQATISLIARGTVDLVNRRILEELVASGQEESEDLETLLPAAQESATALRAALEAGDAPEAAKQRRRLGTQLSLIQQQTGSTEVLIDNIRDDFAATSQHDGISSNLATLSADVDTIDVSAVGQPLDHEISEMERIEQELAMLSASLRDFRKVPPDVLVSPFGAESDVVGATDLDITSFYAPGVIALLIQHIGITFGGLSLVRERALGTPEVFRVSPVHAAQILAGKYIGYLAAIAVVAAALSLLMLQAFSVPLTGSNADYALVLAALGVTSIGVGFVISAIVRSDTQAVNVSLIVLLLSIFFSGFFLSLDRIVAWVRSVSWALPITHAIDSLRDVMFRAEPIEARTIIALGGGSLLFFVAGLMLLQWRLRAE